MTKSEFHINIKNWRHIIKKDTLIIATNCIRLKSMIRENVESLKNIKNNLYSVKKTVIVSKLTLKS